MARVDSLDEGYEKLNKFSKTKNRVFLAAVLATFLSIWLSDFLCFQIIFSAIVIANLVLTVVWELYNNNLENQRIVNAIEIGFGKEINSDVKTEGYYNNGNKPGLRKFVLNLSESLFFTYHIYKKDYVRKTLFQAGAALIIILCLVFVDHKIAVTIIEVVFGMNILYDIVKGIYYYVMLNDLYNKMDRLFISKTASNAVLLAIGFKYEKLKSYVSQGISGKTFTEMNDKLSKEWSDYLRNSGEVIDQRLDSKEVNANE